MGHPSGQESNSSGLPPAAIAAAFERALDAADAFVGATAPNPPVGCAVLDATGQVLAVAAHEKAGAAHAEAAALGKCQANGVLDHARVLLVTLEPCSHHGRTPPCTEAILETSIAEVWIGAHDPNPHVAGGGVEGLVDRGVVVNRIGDLPHSQASELAARAARLIAPFAKRSVHGLPWVTVKQALDRNGGMIPPPGQKTFTSEASLIYAHQLRRRADAIMTGSGTILADDPAFTVRHVPDIEGKQRHLVILDRRRRVTAAYVLAARQRGFDVHVGSHLHTELKRLADEGALEVLVEAGPQLTGSVLAGPHWDRHVLICQATEDGEDDTISVIKRDQTYDWID